MFSRLFRSKATTDQPKSGLPERPVLAEGMIRDVPIEKLHSDIKYRFNTYSAAYERNGYSAPVGMTYIERAFPGRNEIGAIRDLFLTCLNAPEQCAEDGKHTRRTMRNALLVLAIKADAGEIKEIETDIYGLLESENPTTRRNGIHAIRILAQRKITIPGGYDKLKQLARFDDDLEVKTSALKTLSFYGCKT